MEHLRQSTIPFLPVPDNRFDDSHFFLTGLPVSERSELPAGVYCIEYSDGSFEVCGLTSDKPDAKDGDGDSVRG